MKYRKKPVVIEAIQFTGPGSFGDMCAKWREPFLEVCSMDSLGVMQIKTLEGTLLPIENDWIIKGIKGEFYPCKPDIFAATYELAEPVTNPVGANRFG